jgi:hypothetical protein
MQDVGVAFTFSNLGEYIPKMNKPTADMVWDIAFIRARREAAQNRWAAMSDRE